MQFYQHSGRFGALGVPLASACGLFAGLVLGFVYAYAIAWIPLIYINFLATALFGAGIGAAVAYGARIGRMRNMTVAVAVAATMGVVGTYFAWVFDPMARFAQVDRPVWHPLALWEYMKLAYENGFWTIGRNGGAVTGVFLAAVWVAEAALIIGVAGFTLIAMLGEQPFCEETDQWTRTQKNVAHLSLVNDEQAEAKLARLMEGELAALGQFYRAVGEEPAILQLDLATCPDCHTCNYLTVKMIQQVPNKKGEVTKQETKLLVNLQIAHDDVARVREAGCERPDERAAEEAVVGTV